MIAWFFWMVYTGGFWCNYKRGFLSSLVWPITLGSALANWAWENAAKEIKE